MIIKLIQPKIRGVAVVCEGGGSDAVRQEITQAITAVLDISASRVYITKCRRNRAVQIKETRKD